MKSRKIFNYESVILIEMTEQKEGYHPDVFGKKSGKFIWAVCRFCGEPSRIRKGFFNNAGSACHKECRFKEQSIAGSPFKDDAVKEKIKKTNLERYGVEHACQNKEIAARISTSKLTPESQEKTIKTNIERYGVSNPFQAEEIKTKIRETCLEKYGTESAMQSLEIQEKTKKTLIEKYGVDNLRKNPEFLEKAKKTFAETIANDEDGHYTRINFVRSEGFWEEVKNGKSIREICEKFNMEYSAVASAVSNDEFKERFRNLYAYPKTQKQKEIENEIKKMGCQVISNAKDVIAPWELDIYIPDKKVAIEFNGSYWHSEDYLTPERAKHKHSRKTKKCQKLDIRLIHIFEATWNKKQEAYLGLIKSVLGCNEQKIGARKCEISFTNCKDFLEKHHIQGYGSRSIKYINLEYEKEIVGTVTASKHHRQNISGNPVVLNRMCFKNNVTVQGGVSKLLDEFKSWAIKEGFDRILTWSDNSLTDGNAYKQNGFVLEDEYGPDYFYWDVKENIYRSKQSQQKKKTGCPEEITEREWCKSHGLHRIWDCGKKLWIFSLKEILND